MYLRIVLREKDKIEANTPIMTTVESPKPEDCTEVDGKVVGTVGGLNPGETGNKNNESEGKAVRSTAVDRPPPPTESPKVDEVDKKVVEVVTELAPEIEEPTDELVEEIDEDFIEKVRATGENSKAWQAMRRRGKKEFGKDYLLKTLPILPSIPGKPVGRGRKAAMASKKRGESSANKLHNAGYKTATRDRITKDFRFPSKEFSVFTF